MDHDFECKKVVCTNGTSDSSPQVCKCGEAGLPFLPRTLHGFQCHGYMDYWRGIHSGDYTNRWSHCSVHDLTNYVKVHNDCGPFCHRCRAYCLRHLSGSETEYANACEILPLISNSSAVCDSCDQSNATTKPHCDACTVALGLDNEAAWDCFSTNPTIMQCDPDGNATHAEVAQCVEAECSLMILQEESSWGLSGEHKSFPTLLVSVCMSHMITILVFSNSFHYCWVYIHPHSHCTCRRGILPTEYIVYWIIESKSWWTYWTGRIIAWVLV